MYKIYKIKRKYIESNNLYISNIDESKSIFIDYDQILIEDNKQNLYALVLNDRRIYGLSETGVLSTMTAIREKVLINNRVGWILEDALEVI